MGKFDGKQIIGLVGNLVFKKGRDKNTTIIQTKAKRVKQTKATIEAGLIFGKASKLAKTIRVDFSPLTDDYYDGTMVNRLNKLNREILNHCYDKNTKKFTFKPESFDRLKEFEFNIKSPLANTLWVNPTISLQGNQLHFNLPEMVMPESLTFPLSANECEIKVLLVQIILEQSLNTQTMYQSLHIKKDQRIIPAHQFTFEVPDGCLCIIGMNLFFTKKQHDIRTPINDKSFNPTAISGAVISPGTFKLPTEINPSNGKEPRQWFQINELEL